MASNKTIIGDARQGFNHLDKITSTRPDFGGRLEVTLASGERLAVLVVFAIAAVVLRFVSRLGRLKCGEMLTACKTRQGGEKG